MLKNIITIIFALISIISSYWYYSSTTKNNDLQSKITKLEEKIKNLVPWDEIALNITDKNNCKVKEIDYIVSGESMTPLIKNWAKLKVIENYYKCSWKVQRWDVIIYKSSSISWEIVKQIKALPWDKIKFDKSSMILNGELLKNSSWSIYSFQDQEIKLMSAYLRSWALQDATFFAFGDNVKNSIDSRKIGWIGIIGFVGKVEIK